MLQYLFRNILIINGLLNKTKKEILVNKKTKIFNQCNQKVMKTQILKYLFTRSKKLWNQVNSSLKILAT